MSLLHLHNYKHGFLVSENAIAGVTELAETVFAAYSSDSNTGETLYFEEFSTAEKALNALEKHTSSGWTYESIGCHDTTKTSEKKSNSGCSACSSSGCSK